MSVKEFYYTISQPAFAEFKDRGSRFLAYAYPIQSTEEFKNYLQQLKKEHPKAVHHCFAYRVGLDANNFRSSDDGEPSGTAGKPILGQIDSKELTNVLVVVVRYFGGTLLGVSGLINAYKTATTMTLQLTPVVRKAVKINYVLHFDYTQMNEVMKIVKQFDCVVLQKEIELFCVMIMGISKKNLENVLNRLKDLKGMEVEKN